MKIIYAISGLLVLSVAVLVLMGPGTGHADCAAQDDCGWSFNPVATTAAPTTGFFDDAITINWTFSFDPIGATVEFDSATSTNISSAQYDPSEFYTGGCIGGQLVNVEGNLANDEQDGILRTKATIGPFPACVRTKSLAVDHS